MKRAAPEPQRASVALAALWGNRDTIPKPDGLAGRFPALSSNENRTRPGRCATLCSVRSAELNAVDNYMSDVNNNLGLQSGFTAKDVWIWAGKPRTPNGPRNWKALPASLYYHGHYCGAGGTGEPTDALDATCMVHDFLYDQYGYSMGSNFQNPFKDLDPDPTLQKINQGLCDGAASAGGISGGAVQGYFTYGVTPITLGSGVGCR
jgi:hypothetical protein